MNPWNRVIVLLNEEAEGGPLQTKLQAFEAKMGEALSLKNELYMALEQSVTEDPQLADDNGAWKHLHDFQETGLGIDKVMHQYKEIINDFEQFIRDRKEEVQQEKAEAAGQGSSAAHGPVFHR